MKALLAVVWLGVAWLAGLIWLAPQRGEHPVAARAEIATLDAWPVVSPASAETVDETPVQTVPAAASQAVADAAPRTADALQGASKVAPAQDALAAAAQAKIDRLRARQVAQADVPGSGAAAVTPTPVAPPPASPLPSPSPLVLKAASNPRPAASASLAVTPGACARLGLFPDAQWATRVVGLLLPSEPADGMRWRIVPVKGKGYYLVINGLTTDTLSARLESQRPSLGGLVSRWVKPESCA